MFQKIWNWLRDESNRETLKFLGIAVVSIPPVIIGAYTWLQNIDSSSASSETATQLVTMDWKGYRDQYLTQTSSLGYTLYKHDESDQEFLAGDDEYLTEVFRKNGRLTKGELWNTSYQDVELVEVNSENVQIKLTDNQALIDQLSACCGYDDPSNPNTETLSVTLGGSISISQGYEGGSMAMYITEIIGFSTITYETFSTPYVDNAFAKLKELAQGDGIEITGGNF